MGGPGPEGKGQDRRPLAARRLLPQRARAGRRTPCVRDQDAGPVLSGSERGPCVPAPGRAGALRQETRVPTIVPEQCAPPGVVGESQENQSQLWPGRRCLWPQRPSRQATTRLCLRAPPTTSTAPQDLEAQAGGAGWRAPSRPCPGGLAVTLGGTSPRCRWCFPGRDRAPRTDPQLPGRGPPHPSTCAGPEAPRGQNRVRCTPWPRPFSPVWGMGSRHLSPGGGRWLRSLERKTAQFGISPG